MRAIVFACLGIVCSAGIANPIHHNYPGDDYEDLMSVVDAAIGQGFVDENALFVIGGSGGGALTAWIVGRTQRFKVAAAQMPVFNWASAVLAWFERYRAAPAGSPTKNGSAAE